MVKNLAQNVGRDKTTTTRFRSFTFEENTKSIHFIDVFL